MSLEAIIFDFDGVIVETEALHYQATIAALKDDNIHFTYEVYAHKYIGLPDLLMFPLIGEKYGINVHDLKLQELLDKKRAAYAEADLRKLPVCPGVVKLITEASKHVQIGLCTGAHRGDIAKLLPYLDQGRLQHYFKTIVTSDDVKHTKPDPEGYLKAAKALGVAPENCLVIEDSPTGIAAGKAADMTVLAVCTSHKPLQLDGADHVVHRLDEVNFATLQAWFN
ncbi:MAG: HAD family phosphatase [Gammaproteobacteria bacterium]|nr:HAD family phosphatase [Gammaproteobacteria bacterium]